MDTQPVASHPMKTYRFHKCQRTHREYHTLARCIWPYAIWVWGAGPYATLAKCDRRWTVRLWPTEAEAREVLRAIDYSGCGSGCDLTGAQHELIQLNLARESTSERHRNSRRTAA